MKVELSRRNLGTILVVLVVVLVLCQGIRMSMQHTAMRNLNEAKTAVEKAESSFRAANTELVNARRMHFAVYLEKFTSDQPEAELLAAKELIEKAAMAKKPAIRTKFAQEAVTRSRQVRSGYEGWHDEFALLDQALAGYQSEPSKLQAYIDQLAADIRALEKQGYFSQQFVGANNAKALAVKNHDTAISLSATKFQKNLPDYRSVFIACLEGERLAGEGRKLMSAVPDLDRDNQRRISEFGSRVSLVLGRYNRALFAAGQLERYPHYQILGSVRQSYGQMDSANNWLAWAKSNNAMSTQKFSEAKENLDRANELVDNALLVFSQAETNWTRIQNANAGIPDQRTAARSSINRASSYASQWSQNSQSRAKSLISQAESQFQTGQDNENSDPIISIDAYQGANSLGNQAYSAVDDVDHTPSPSSSDYSSGGSSSSGSSSSYGGGSSSGGSSSSGSYDSGPSGSYDSGPTGSYNGGGL